MQVLKDEIKERIIDAALKLFAEKGYQNTTMNEIASKAGISVGNVYLYYKNKQVLFQAVIPEDFLLAFKSLIQKKIGSAKGTAITGLNNNPVYLLAGDEMLDFYYDNRFKLIAVFAKGEGTKYAGAKNDLLDYLVSLFYGYIGTVFDQTGREKIEAMRPVIRLVYANLFTCFFEAFKQFTGKEELRQVITQILNYHLAGLNGLMR